MENRYQFYEVVQVITIQSDNPKHILGLEGTVLGMTQSEHGDWIYGVYLYEREEVWNLWEYELKATGKVDSYEGFYDGTSIRVSVDPNNGGRTSK